MRCAIYARYSSDRQKATSIDDQIRKCRQYAEARKWQILEECIFTDDAISGSRSDREGFNRMLGVAKQKPPRFDCLLVDDTSRFARDLPYALTKTDLLAFYGVEIQFVAQGINSKSEQFRTLMTVNGMIDEQYSTSLSQKTKRGLEGTAIRGNHTGSRCFGYRNIAIESPDRKDAYGRPAQIGARLVVDSDQAVTVRRIFDLYGAGYSLKAIAKLLNAEKTPSPKPSAGRIQQSWCPSSVRTILRNERYRGVVIFGKTRKVKNPTTGKRIQRPGDPASMVRQEVPEQKIVSDTQWNKVQSRLAAIRTVFGERGCRGGLSAAGNAAGSRYLFSGLLKCSECGANLVILSGRGSGHGNAQYGCPMHAFRNTCTNNVRVRRDVLETQLLAKLQEDVLRDELIEYALVRLEDELKKAARSAGDQLASFERKKVKLQKELANLTKAVASGLDSPTVRVEIANREKGLAAINSQIVSAKPEGVAVKVRDIRKFVTLSLKDIRKLLGSDTATAKATLARHMPQIVLKPNIGPDGKKSYMLVSEWKLLGSCGGADLALLGGAEGEN